MRIRFAYLLSGALAFAASTAQAWTYMVADDGTFLVGQTASDERFIAIGCVRLSEQFTGPVDQDWSLTAPGTVSFRLSRFILTADAPTRSDVAIVVDGVPIALPPLQANPDSLGYEVDLPLDHPLFTALWEGANAVVEAGGIAIAPISLDYAQDAIPAMLDQCAQTGRP